jgi:hypothetical protein
MPEPDPASRPRLPKILGTQTGLLNPSQIDQIRADMVAGRFDYLAGRIFGLRDGDGVYYVKDGHHRMVAAMEIYKKTGDPSIVLSLLHFGKWDNTVSIPNDSQRLPTRSWWAAFRAWMGI